MPEYSIETIIKITGGHLVGQKKGSIRHLSFDSRNISQPENNLFIAIKGEQHNGHSFVSDAYNLGIRFFLVSELTEKTSSLKGASTIVVDNTVNALQKIASYHRTQYKNTVIGITGSNGKTIVKEWLSYCLSSNQKVIRNPKSYNSQIGVPLSVWFLEKDAEAGVFEAGISRPGEMKNLADIIKPTHGLFTTLGDAHQDNFSSSEEKLDEKLTLFESCQSIYYCRDHESVHNKLNDELRFKNCKKISWSHHNKGSNMNVAIVNKTPESTLVEINFKTEKFIVNIPFGDKASIENALHVINYLIDNNFPVKQIQKSVSGLHPVAMRLEQIKGANDCLIINDTYNSDINSISIALDYLNQQPLKEKALILSDILQIGSPERELYRKVADLVKLAGIKTLIGVGESISRQKSLFASVKTHVYSNVDELIDSGILNTLNHTAVLIKGARSFRFEKIVNAISEKNHTTLLEINLSNLIYNLNYFRRLLKPQTGIMVMVKALAYGSGSFEIANLLQHEKVNYLGVAFTDEGIQLRQNGIMLPIMVMSPNTDDFQRIIDNNLEPEIYSFSVLKQFSAVAQSMQAYNYPIHLKIDTGMHRLGFLENEVDQVLNHLSGNKFISVKAVFSHLAASDIPSEEDFTRNQINTFSRIYDKICSAIDYKPMRHILNSAGIERFPEAHFEMVRLGIGLHGISAINSNLLAAGRLITHISQIKRIPKEDTIGYNRKGKAYQDMKIAIIPIGYADGLDRRFGNQTGSVIINGQACPFIGDICMDMSMVDITHINCAEGDEVVIFGPENTISKLAKQIKTIPYEILTNVSSRVKRIYLKE